MRNVYKIEKFQTVHNNLHFSLNEKNMDIQIKPVGQVLVDSDDFSFIYLMEEGENYSYLSFSREFWPQLIELIKSEKNPYLQLNHQLIELVDYTDELLYLIHNIEGNDNYGSEFVKVVEETFGELLQGNSD